MSTSALAENFEANEFITTARSGAFEFSIETIDGEITAFKTGATVFEYTFGSFDAYLYSSLTYGRFTDTLNLTFEYNLKTEIDSRWILYGTTAISYVTPTISLSNGDVFFIPTIGISYALNDNFDVFGDITYSWNVSNDWNYQDGLIEIGIDYALNDRVSITPSIIRTFNTSMDTTNFRFEVGFNF
jgi:hypothetical protein